MNELEEKIMSVFQEILSISDNENMNEIIYNEYPGWDSVGHMALIAGLEEAFDCMMDMDDILDLSSFEKSIKIMSKYVE